MSAFRLHEAAEELRKWEAGIQETKPGFEIQTEDARCRGRREREAVRMRLEREGEIELANKLAKCGLPVPLVCTHCGLGKVVETRCKKRWCPSCAWSVQRERLDRFGGAVDLMQWPLFITLTMRNSGDVECVRELRRRWGMMRRRKLLKEKVLGGVASIEVTNRGNGWHPHLHVIADCEWLALHTPAPRWDESEAVRTQKREHAKLEITALWQQVIGDTDAITWIKRVKDESFLRYCLKYSVKGSTLIECKDAIGPLIKVMERSRLVSAFGCLHGRTAEMVDDDRPVLCCSQCQQEKTFLPLDVAQMMSRGEPTRSMTTAHFGEDFHAARRLRQS